MRNTTVIVPLLLMMSGVSHVQAETEESELMLGLGVSVEDSIYKGVGKETDVLPLFAYEKGNFFIQGPSLGYHLFETENVQISALAEYRMDGYDAKDSADLTGMADRKGAFELGVSAAYENHWGEWSATLLADVSNEHDGYELALGWEQRMELSQRWALTPEASLSYRSDDLNNYYYGVTAAEATAQRAAYVSDAGMVYEVGLNADYMIDQQQQIRVGASYQSFGDEISNSSIVEDDSSYAVQAIYLYRF